MQEKSEKAKQVQRRPAIERLAISESGNDVIFYVIYTDPLDPERAATPLSDVELPADEPEGLPVQQEEPPEIQQSQEEDSNASSAKVIGLCQPHDDDFRP